MSNHRPPPLTPSDSDLRDFGFMPLDVVRFAQSDLVAFAPPDAIVAAILLWGASWHQQPAASLTNDDRALANLAGYGRAVGEWLKVKADALRGFVECSDGRLYHPVVADKARDAWTGKLRQRHRTYLAAIRQHNLRNPHDQRQGPGFDDWTAAGQPTTVREASRASQDDELPLPAPAAPERVTRDNDSASRVTEGGCHADITRDSVSKGQGEGQGEGEGDSKNNNTRGDASPADAVAAFDFVEVTDTLARRAGVPHSQPAHISRNMAVVREWHRDGIDIEGIVIPEIDRFRQNEPERSISALRFFDSSVRAKVAGDAAKARKGGRAAPPMAKVAPLTTTDQDHEQVRALRRKFAGNITVGPDRVALAIVEDDRGTTVVVTARSAYIAKSIDRAMLQRIAVEVVGTDRVEVLSQ